VVGHGSQPGRRHARAKGAGQVEAGEFPRLQAVFADHKYINHTLDNWMEREGVSYRIEVSSKPADQHCFVPLKIRWVVERTFAWLDVVGG